MLEMGASVVNVVNDSSAALVLVGMATWTLSK